MTEIGNIWLIALPACTFWLGAWYGSSHPLPPKEARRLALMNVAGNLVLGVGFSLLALVSA